MTDRELLEAAARAAGMRVVSYNHSTGSMGYENSGGKWWNPLTDDGDALRLALKLRLTVCFGGVTPARQSVCVGGPDGYLASEPYGTDPAAATRRAIVCAAAEMAAPKEKT